MSQTQTKFRRRRAAVPQPASHDATTNTRRGAVKAKSSAAKGQSTRPPTAYQLAKRDKRRREILNAAAEVFAEKGYFAATIQDIADRIEMRPGSLYYHLTSKEEALAEVCRIGGKAFIDGAEAILASGKPVPEMIRDGIRLHLDARWRNYVSNFAFNRGMLPENVLPEMNDVARSYHDAWARILKLGQKQKVLAADVDPRTAAAALLSTCNGAVSAAPDGANADDVADRVFRLFMGGVEAR